MIEFIFYNLEVEVFQVFYIIQIYLTQMLAFVDCLLYLGYFPVVVVVVAAAFVAAASFVVVTFVVVAAVAVVQTILAVVAFEVNIAVEDQVAVVEVENLTLHQISNQYLVELEPPDKQYHQEWMLQNPKDLIQIKME
jgi:hypothetical protein